MCSNSVITEGNCLATVNPKLAKEWCYELNGDLAPEKVQSGGKREVWWKCPICLNRWKAQLYQRNN